MKWPPNLFHQCRSLSISTSDVEASRRLHSIVFGEQGWRSGESTRLPPMWPGFDSWTRRHMWVE